MVPVSNHFGADDTDTDDEDEKVLLDEQVLEANEDEDNEDGSSDDDDPKEIDFEAAINDVRDGSMSKADFAAFKSSVNRSLGQVKTLQSAVSKLEKLQVDGESVAANSEILGALIAALPSVLDTSDPAFAQLRTLQERRAQAEVTRDAIAKMRADADDETPDSDDGTGNAMSNEDKAAWNTASSLVNGYAKAKGVDPASVEKAVWDKAIAGSMGDPQRAAELMYAVVDGLASGSDSKQSDRAARKAAGKAGTPDKSGSGSGSTLTLAKLRGMTQEQIMKLPPEEVDRVIASA
jgi:hypothetical protein